MLPSPNHSPEPPTLPIRDLKQFLEEIRKLFDNVVYHWDYILFEEEFRPRSKAAWEELRRIFEDWQEQVSTTPARDLQNAGLLEAQLDLKLGGLSSAWSRFKERGTVRLLRNVLGCINAILGSMPQVIPGVEALKELKEAIERLITADEP